MADDKKDKADKDKNKSAEETDQTSPSANNNSKMKLIVIMALCLVLLSVTAMVSTIFLTINRDTTQVAAVDNKTKSSENFESEEKDTSEEAEEEEDEASEQVDNGPPLFYQFNPTFIVNIPAKGRTKFLQVQVQVMSYDSKVIESVEQYAPLIKNDLVQLFSQQEYNDLLKPDSKENLRMKSLKLIKTLLTKHTGEDGVEQVLFTSFITQ